MRKLSIFNFNFINKDKGAILTMVLVFGTIFVLLFGGLAGFIYTQYKQSKQKVAYNEALEVAEAGANYARWHLAHAPNDYDFSGVIDYQDPESGIIGQYSLNIVSGGSCSTMVSIEATGWSKDYPDVKRTVKVSYGKASLAEYSYLTNSDIWFGESEDVKGPLHSNGGIRMDGTQNALFTSATTTYRCLPIHGCSSPYEVKPGIWGSGAGGGQGLWSFPVPTIDFNAITLDLDKLRKEARDHGGNYFGPSGAFGYHINFKNDGSFDLYKVTKVDHPITVKDTVSGQNITESLDISKETKLGSYWLGETGTCTSQNLIFVEDKKVWVDGVLKRKATIAAGQFPDDVTTNASIVINGNMTRADPKDTMLALIAQKNILLNYHSPNVLEIQAVMMAQKGAVLRYPYNNTKNRIMVRGSIITNKIWTWSYVDSHGDIVSGYENTESYYEPALIYAPPPYFPTAGDLEFISWKEQN